MRWESNKNYDLLCAEHYGYLKLKHPVVHRRQFFFDKNKELLKIDDFFNGSGLHTYEILFHFGLTVYADPNVPLLFRTALPDGYNIAIVPEIKDGLKVQIRSGWFSPSYGVRVNAPYLCYTRSTQGPVQFRFFIYRI